jgi:hypothetical protein
MFCCGGNEEEPHGPPANQYTAPPKGANIYGGGGSSFYSLFPILVLNFLEFLASIIEIYIIACQIYGNSFSEE